MHRLRIHLCPECQTKISDLIGAHGRDTAMNAAPSVIADCQRCSPQLPDELRASVIAGRYETRDKTEPPTETFVERGRIVIP